MNTERKNQGWLVLSIFLIVAAAVRLIPHPMNFAPLAGMALLGAAHVKDTWKAWLLPVLAFWLSDLVLNNIVYASYFEGFVWASTPFLFSVGAMLLIVFAGKSILKKISIGRLIGASLSASLIFFLVSNFGSWAEGMLYPKSLTGLMEAYVAGLPFLKGTVIGDLIWTGVLFGAWYLIFDYYQAPQKLAEQAVENE